MTIVSSGYKGTITDVQWARNAHLLGSAPVVEGVNDWAVTATTGADRQVTVAAGVAHGFGITDRNDASIARTTTAPTGTRWDLVVLRRTWSSTGGTSDVVIIPGGASPVVPAVGTGAAQRRLAPGDVADQPLALIRVVQGQTAVAEVRDLRVRSGKVLTAPSLLAVPDVRPGARLVAGGLEYEGKLVGGTLQWARTGNPVVTEFPGRQCFGAAWDGLRPVRHQIIRTDVELAGGGGFNLSWGPFDHGIYSLDARVEAVVDGDAIAWDVRANGPNMTSGWRTAFNGQVYDKLRRPLPARSRIGVIVEVHAA